MTHPEKWYIPVTEENHDELNQWRLSKRTREASRHDNKFVPGATLLSAHPCDDGSYFYMKGYSITQIDNGYQEITLEQFRQITNTMKHPKKWYIPVTNENHDELNQWRLRVATSYRDMKLNPYDSVVLSAHHRDGSYYYADGVKGLKANNAYNDYQEITLEQFREITNPTQTTMSKQIQISRELLNEYYEASTTEQKAYLSEHFKLDGSTTVEAIRGLHDLACRGWRPKIKANHPDCFPEDSKYFDFSEHVNKSVQEKRVVSADVCESLGLTESTRGFIQVRNNSGNPQTHHRSFYLSSKYNWELVQDGTEDGRPIMVLIPTKK
jgi:hypothetical protein